MKYIKTFENFRFEDKLNEEILGTLWKNLTKRLSLGFSKMFGSASAANKVLDNYKKERIKWENQKTTAVRSLAEFLKSQKEGAEKDDDKKKELVNNLKKQELLYDKNLDLVKQKFDLKLKEVIEDEKNPKIQNYINLKKIELEQEFLQNELKIIQGDLGLTEDIIKTSPEFQKYFNSLNNKAKESKEAADKETNILKSKSDVNEFNFEEAKSNKDYLWKDSKFTKGEYKFTVGEEIKVYINNSNNKEISTATKDGDEYRGTTAYVYGRRDSDSEDLLRISYNPGAKDENTFTISKGKVVTTKKLEEEKKKSEEKKEQEA